MLRSRTLKRLNLCTKKLFDDLLLHIAHQAEKHTNVNQEASYQWEFIERDHNPNKEVRPALMINENVELPLFSNSKIEYGLDSARRTTDFELNSSRNFVASQESKLRGLTPINHEPRLATTFWQNRRG